MFVKEIHKDQIHIDHEENCRGMVDVSSAAEIAESIKAIGLQQPVLCRNAYADEKHGKPYVAVSGFTRMYAVFTILKKDTIHAVIKDMTPVEAIVANWEENVKRKNLNILQEARPIGRLMSMGLTQKEICARLNKSPGWISPRMQLLRLDKELQAMAAEGFLTEEHIRTLSFVKDKETRVAMAVDIRDQRLSGKLKRIVIRPPITDTKRKQRAKRPRARNKNEIENLLLHLFDSDIEEGLATKALAWAAGNISDIDMMLAIREENSQYCVDYVGFQFSE